MHRISTVHLIGAAAYVVGLIARWRYILELHHPRNHVYADALPITALGEILTDPGTQQGFVHTIWPPGMSAFLALNFVFDPTGGTAAVGQLVASALVPILVARAAYIAYGRRAAWIALTMASLHAGFVHYDGFFLSEGMFQLGVAVAVWMTSAALAAGETTAEDGSSAPAPARQLVVRGLASGLAWGLAFSLRPTALPIALFVAGTLAVRWLRQRRSRLCFGLLAGALGFLVLFAPLSHRCTALNGSFCPGASNGAMNVALGHAPDVAGLTFRPAPDDPRGGPDTWFPPARQPHGFSDVGEVPASIYDGRRILVWVKQRFLDDPLQFTVDSVGNAFDLFGSAYWPDNYASVRPRRVTVLKQAFLFFVLVPGMAIWGADVRRLLRRQKQTTDIDAFFVALILGLFCLAAATMGEARYRIPFDVAFIVLAARVFAGVKAPVTEERKPRSASSAAAIACVLAVVGALVVTAAHPRVLLAARLAEVVRAHRPARKIAGTLRLSELSSPRVAGTPWDAAGNFRFPCTPTCAGLEVDLAGTVSSAAIEVSADHNDRYEVAFYRGGTYLGRVAWGWDTSAGAGLRLVQLPVPERARATGYDRLRIRPLYGDGNYSIGHVRFL